MNRRGEGVDGVGGVRGRRRSERGRGGWEGEYEERNKGRGG